MMDDREPGRQNNMTLLDIKDEPLEIDVTKEIESEEEEGFGQQNGQKNADKTLKCPKCNWHYKYIETLEAHIREKHGDDPINTGNTNCCYCRERQPHPRLARGETYPCGYKPYRCEVCGYSTTTKGNLTIHLQSDKHANNVRVLQAAGKLPKRITVMPDSHIITRQEQQDDITRPWRCEPCGYSTSIASNLRIHLSSEKHSQAIRKLDAVFLCGICTKFTSESADQLESHVNKWRNVEEDFGLQQQQDVFVCNICNYQTQLKSNFAIHCKTDKHISRQQLAAHIREGGVTNEWRLRYLPQGLQLVCQLCQFTAASWDGLKLHVANEKHINQYSLYQKIKRLSVGLDCSVCGIQVKNTLELVRHSMEHNHQLSKVVDVNENIQRQSPIKYEMKTEPEVNCPLCLESVKDSIDVHLKKDHFVREDVIKIIMTNMKDESNQMLVGNSISEDIQSNLIKQYLNPLRPYRCTICLESFEHDVNLQVHLLSGQHQDRTRPNMQKALLALQGLKNTTFDPASNLDNVLKKSLITPKLETPSPFNLTTVPDFVLERLGGASATTGSDKHNLSSRYLPSKLENQSNSVVRPACDERQSSTGSPSSRVSNSPQSVTQVAVRANEYTNFTEIEIQLLEMLFSLNLRPPEELIIATARDTGIDVEKIRCWLDMKRRAVGLARNDMDFIRSDQSDTVSTTKETNEDDFSDDESNNDHANRRMRTLISPDQAEVLYREYLEDNCPPRQRLEEIASQTGLKRRVVQVWFQNTRARERKGQYRSVSMFAQKPADLMRQLKPLTVIKPKLTNQPPSVMLMEGLKQKLAENQEIKSPQGSPRAESMETMNALHPLAITESHESASINKLSLPTILTMTSKQLNQQIQQQLINNNFSKISRGISNNTAGETSSGSRDHNDNSKRSRTQLTNGQVNAMQATFELYRSPSLAECEILGSGIGLARRVVQVWFQNHRAKERRARAAVGQTPEPPTPEPPENCSVCDALIKGHAELREHLFSQNHVDNLKKAYNIGSESSSPIAFDPYANKQMTLGSDQSRHTIPLSYGTSPSGSLPIPKSMPDIGLFANLKNLSANIQRIIAAKALFPNMNPGDSDSAGAATVTELP